MLCPGFDFQMVRVNTMPDATFVMQFAIFRRCAVLEFEDDLMGFLFSISV